MRTLQSLHIFCVCWLRLCKYRLRHTHKYTFAHHFMLRWCKLLWKQIAERKTNCNNYSCAIYCCMEVLLAAEPITAWQNIEHCYLYRWFKFSEHSFAMQSNESLLTIHIHAQLCTERKIYLHRQIHCILCILLAHFPLLHANRYDWYSDWHN